MKVRICVIWEWKRKDIMKWRYGIESMREQAPRVTSHVRWVAWDKRGLSVAQLSWNQSGPAGKQKAATYYVFLGCPTSFDAQAISTLPEAGNVTDVLECPGKGIGQLFIPGWKSILGRGGPLHCRVAEEPQHGLKTRMDWTCELQMRGTTSECKK